MTLPGTRVPLSRRFPALLPMAVGAHQARRLLRWHLDTVTGRVRWAHRQAGPLPVLAHRHASPLLRRLGDSEMWLQHNKVANLRLAAAHTDGLLIAPGETFSFNKVVGNCTRRKGYVDGMRLSAGEATAGVGGGICQLANLIHWMVLHSPLTVVERSEHSFDAFPDEGRVVPWGVGCTIVWNYVDLVVRNDTDLTFQLGTTLEGEDLRGELRASGVLRAGYRVGARHERFTREDGEVWRSNEIWRTVTATGDGTVSEELVKTNRALVRYDVDEARLLR
jgi:vancomycin resistance protein VanW